ncbi:MAG: DUF393 domain-containing protein [Bacteroidetes bacterium]|nr:DUF393 domain-containing protein [Bacteroidota bacterium]
MKKEKPILLFDGVCNLCNGAVNFVMKLDDKKQFYFVTLQSERGKELVAINNISLETDSVILILENQVYLESEAVIQIAGLLPFPWNLFSVFQIIPVKIRNSIYSWIAKNRYRWFGKRNSCRVL